jgi:arylsulfatase
VREGAGAKHRGRAIGALLALALGCRAPERELPNLALITIDTLRPDRLACGGGAGDVGAAICRVAREGIRYRWSFSTAPSTAPSVASLLTSRYPAQHGVGESAVTQLAPGVETLAELLGAAGYRCGAVIANPVLAGERGFERGFDSFDAEMNRSEPNRPGYRERDARHATDAAIAWLGNGEGPWFLWVHYQDPHGPYEPPGAVPPVDAPTETPLRVLGDHSGRGGIPRYQKLGDARDPATYARRYVDEIRFLDFEIQRLFEKLAELDPGAGLLLTADHGEAFGEDGYWFAHGHALGFDQIRVPLFWRPPAGMRWTAGGVSDEVVSGIDVAATLVEAAALQLPPGFEGRPLPRDSGELAENHTRRRGRRARAIFAEHRLRAALVIGSHYYARDREPFEGPVADPISGGWLFPIAARRAELVSEEATPAYFAAASAADDAALEALLADYLAEPGARKSAEKGGALSPETRAALAALGYLN